MFEYENDMDNMSDQYAKSWGLINAMPRNLLNIYD